MAKQLQLRRGTTAANDLFTGADGEVTVDTTNHSLRVHNGSTQGGYLVDTVVFFQRPTADNGYTWARKYASGWVEQGGVVIVNSSTSGTETVINLPVTMADSNYTSTVGLYDTSNDTSLYFFVCNKAVGAITLKSNLTASGAAGQQSWRIEGMAA